MRKEVWKYLTPIIAAVLIAGFAGSVGAETIKVGALNDMTGATSDVGKDYALGIAEAIHYVNENGGVNGKEIKLYQFDYGYRVPEALTKYKLFKRLGCVAVLGWGTGDTEALSPTVTKDKMPYISASYSGHLTDPKKTPYNLFFATDYSTNARAALTAWFDEKWPKHPDYGKRKPRMLCSYMFASPYCSAPHQGHQGPGGLSWGLMWVTTIRTSPSSPWIPRARSWPSKNSLLMSSGTATPPCLFPPPLRDAYSPSGLKAGHGSSTTGALTRTCPSLAGEAAEGAMGATPVCAFFGANVL